jgi:hypothetical protein
MEYNPLVRFFAFQNQLDSQGAGAASGYPLALRENTRKVISLR